MAEHYEVPFYGAEGTICAADGAWWPCETVAPRQDDGEHVGAAGLGSGSGTAGDSR